MTGGKAIIQNVDGLTLKVKSIEESVHLKQSDKKF
jgi:hypothetical protein